MPPKTHPSELPGASAGGLDRHTREIELLGEISRLLDHSLDLREVAGPMLEALSAHMAMKYATLTLLNRKAGEILIEASHGLSAQQAQRGRYRLGEGVTGQVALSGKPIVIPRTSESPMFLDKTQRGKRSDTSFICVPIKVEQEVAGTLSADRAFDPGADLQQDVRLLTIIASMIAQAVKLRRAVQEDQGRLAEHQILAGAAFEVDRALAELACGGAERKRLAIAVLDRACDRFDAEPAGGCGCGERSGDQQEAQQQGAAKGETKHVGPGSAGNGLGLSANCKV